MRTDARHDLHLTYCTNIHPGERWADVRRAVETHVPAVKQMVAPDRPFGVGLRLGGTAAEDLQRPAAREELIDLLRRHDLYVFTLNGFPHGAFHGTAVKAAVYRPDWSEPSRVSYTRHLVDLLATVLPADVEGSISTVPGCFRPRADERDILPTIARNLLECTAELWRRAEETGTRIVLALEPEPHCLLERIDETVAFFETWLLAGDAFEHFLETTGLRRAEGEQAVRRHLGVCLDTCHAAVEFEDPVTIVTHLRAAAIRVAKVQVTTGLKVSPITARSIERLRDFADPVYLHQTVIRRGHTLDRFLDLPEAIAAHERGEAEADEWRIHFHVPVFCEQLDSFENTQAFLRPCLQALVDGGASRHFEVETYTWDVLPPQHRNVPVADAIARELRWTLERLSP
jgi:sugar phosphate isomerase/epimerase